jgi:hypothetical protein
VEEAIPDLAVPAGTSGPRPPTSELDRHVTATTMLGAMDVRLRLAADGRIAEARITGDVLGSEGVIERLEDALAGAPPTAQAVDAAIAGTLEPPGAFLLGVHPLAALRDVVLRAAA